MFGWGQGKQNCFLVPNLNLAPHSHSVSMAHSLDNSFSQAWDLAWNRKRLNHWSSSGLQWFGWIKRGKVYSGHPWVHTQGLTSPSYCAFYISMRCPILLETWEQKPTQGVCSSWAPKVDSVQVIYWRRILRKGEWEKWDQAGGVSKDVFSAASWPGPSLTGPTGREWHQEVVLPWARRLIAHHSWWEDLIFQTFRVR